MDEWINWDKFPVPEDIRGILIKYEDGIFSDRYDYETKKRKYRDSKILGWKWMERSDPNKKSIQCNQPERLNPETQYPDGTMWQDDSSLDEEGLVETYVRKNGEWIFAFKAKPINFFSPVRCESLSK